LRMPFDVQEVLVAQMRVEGLDARADRSGVDRDVRLSAFGRGVDDDEAVHPVEARAHGRGVEVPDFEVHESVVRLDDVSDRRGGGGRCGQRGEQRERSGGRGCGPGVAGVASGHEESPWLAWVRWTVRVQARPRSHWAVCAFAGKNDSMASSESVTSIGVPNTVVVLRKSSTVSPTARRNGTTAPPGGSCGAAGARSARPGSASAASG